MKKSTPAVKAYNDYAFITDDVNEFVAIVTPTSMHLHRYSDIVSISYEEMVMICTISLLVVL